MQGRVGEVKVSALIISAVTALHLHGVGIAQSQSQCLLCRKMGVGRFLPLLLLLAACNDATFAFGDGSSSDDDMDLLAESEREPEGECNPCTSFFMGTMLAHPAWRAYGLPTVPP